MQLLLGIYIDTLFTNFVLLKDGQLTAYKIPSTDTAVLDGIDHLQLNPAILAGKLTIIHNGTLEVDNLLKNTGVTTVNITHNIDAEAVLFFSQPTIKNNLLAININNTFTTVSIIKQNNNVAIKNPILDIGYASTASTNKSNTLEIKNDNSNATPACFGLGNTQPTIMDAHLILGRIPPSVFSDANLHLDITAARMAMGVLAHRLQKRIEDIAQDIIDLCNEKLCFAITQLVTQHQINLATYKLCSMGDASNLHICAIADLLKLKHGLIPKLSSVLPAVGLLAASQKFNAPNQPRKAGRAAHTRRQLHGIQLPVTVWQQDDLNPEDIVTGPAIIHDSTTSSWLASGWMLSVDNFGNLLLKRMVI